MLFNLSETKHVKNSDDLFQIIEETISLIKKKGGDAKLKEDAVYGEIAFRDNRFYFSLDVSIPLRKLL